MTCPLPSAPGDGAGVLLTSVTAPHLQPRLQGPHAAPRLGPQGQREGAEAGRPLCSWTRRGWPRGCGRAGDPSITPSDILEETSASQKRRARSAEKSYLPSPGQQAARLPGLSAKEPSPVSLRMMSL